jgi:hypothetical protein
VLEPNRLSRLIFHRDGVVPFSGWRPSRRLVTRVVVEAGGWNRTGPQRDSTTAEKGDSPSTAAGHRFGQAAIVTSPPRRAAAIVIEKRFLVRYIFVDFSAGKMRNYS